MWRFGVSGIGIGACLAATLHAQGPSLSPSIRFIGNEAFEITDGRTTILTDYPYQPGYSQYMSYDSSTVRPRGQVVVLITHGHLDHFDRSRFVNPAWRIVGPREVTRTLAPERVIALDSVITVGPATIRPIRTPHAGLEHYAYVVEWGALRLYFPGDTEEPASLVAQRGLSHAFLTPWLWGRMGRQADRIPARFIVFYHHESGERVVGCPTCWHPRQGEELPASFR
ncbi:MAG: MBL fold metallo-hydrolase [Gemmatimonadales bacterium]